MPGAPTPGRMALPADLAEMQRQIAALSNQQTQVITDPTGATGDPAHGHATVVIGVLQQITGIAAYGVAVWNGTKWVRTDNGFLQLATAASRGITFGDSPAFTWSGGIHTQVAVPHGLGITPLVVITSSARFGDAISDDARAPWLTTTSGYDATNFQLLFNTKNNAAIGVFSVPAGACQWIAIG